MNTCKIKKCDYMSFINQYHISPKTIEIYPCVDGEHFVVKQGDVKTIMKIDNYKHFLIHLNRIVCTFKIGES